MTANGANEAASANCVAASAKALQSVMDGGHVFIDHGGRIVQEYRANLAAKGQPGPGDAFLRWLLTHEWNARRVTRVPLASAGNGDDFAELANAPELATYDPSDRKFLAVAAAHPEHPPILQSFDSKWWGWKESLAELGVTIHFLCPGDIEKKHAEKMGR